MGQEYSVDEAEQSDASSPSQEREQTPEDIDAVQDIMDLSGYRVMKVFSGSPASRSNLRPFEDFIVALDGAVVSSDNASLNMALRNAEGRELALVVWNCVDNARRDVALRPVKWNGPGLLGSAVRYEQLRGAAEHVQRVVDVLPGSPADVAGLVPMTDYVVGTPAEVFKNEKQFGRAIHTALERNEAAIFMVYSTATNRVRNVEIRPDVDWGGEGSLGCELATGLLHRITRNSS